MNRRKVAGIICIILGIVLCVGLITYQYIHCVDMWKSDKSMLYDTPLEYFWAVSKGAILIAVVIGFIPIITGICLHRRLK